MKKASLIPTQTICLHFNIDISFVDELNHMGLIQIEVIEDGQFIHHEQIGLLEKIIRLQEELNLNLEGIDIIFNLLDKEKNLREELNRLKNRLQLYEKN